MLLYDCCPIAGIGQCGFCSGSVQHLRTQIEIRPWAITSATLICHPAVAFPSATGNNISLHLLQMVQTMCGLTSSTKLAITSANIWQ